MNHVDHEFSTPLFPQIVGGNLFYSVISYQTSFYLTLLLQTSYLFLTISGKIFTVEIFLHNTGRIYSVLHQ